MLALVTRSWDTGSRPGRPITCCMERKGRGPLPISRALLAVPHGGATCIHAMGRVSHTWRRNAQVVANPSAARARTACAYCGSLWGELRSLPPGPRWTKAPSRSTARRPKACHMSRAGKGSGLTPTEGIVGAAGEVASARTADKAASSICISPDHGGREQWCSCLRRRHSMYLLARPRTGMH